MTKQLRLDLNAEIIVNTGRFTHGHGRGVATRFKPGTRPSIATEIKPRERRSPTTEFRKGQCAPNRLPIGSVTIRVETHTALRRAWIKVGEPNVWQKRAVVVWIAHNGELPRGNVVHHRDRDSLNDEPGNLVAITRKDHVAEHQLELAEAAFAAAKMAITRRKAA